MLKPGDTFGDYRVLRLLGKGGMGSVFLLENASGGQVAAKILDPETASDHESRKRFLREAQLALGVKHPNLVETYDIGEDPDTGLCYILMEYVPGGNLERRIVQKGALPIGEATRIAYEIASALELARQKGVVHRDIKPANIMFGADGKAKLADLGIARSGFGGAGMSTVTQTGMLIGTPAYMAPEQMLDAHNVDSRADIYSLGIVFYEMLTGCRPNKDDTVLQLMAKALKGEPLPDVRTLRPEVSAALAQLIGLMTEKDVAKRIPTPAQVMEIVIRLDDQGAEIQVKSSAPTTAKNSGRVLHDGLNFRSRRRRLLRRWGLVGGLVLVLAIFGGLAFWPRERVQSPASPAPQRPESEWETTAVPAQSTVPRQPAAASSQSAAPQQVAAVSSQSTSPRQSVAVPAQSTVPRQTSAVPAQSTVPQRSSATLPPSTDIRRKAGTSTPEGWEDDYYAAKKMAKKSGKRIFIVFSASDYQQYGYLCKKFERELLSQKTFLDAISPRYVPVYIDTPGDKTLLSKKCREQNYLVAAELEVRAFQVDLPSVRILDADGNMLANLGGAEHLNNGVEGYLKLLGQMENTIDSVAESRRKNAAIMHEALSQLDEELVHEQYLDEVKRIVAADPARYADKYPYVSKILPLERKIPFVIGKFNADCNIRVDKMQREGRKESYQKLRDEVAAAIRAEGMDCYIQPINDLVNEIRGLKGVLRLSGRAQKRMLELEGMLLNEKARLL